MLPAEVGMSFIQMKLAWIAAFAGRHGAVVLLFGILVGLAIPALAEAAKPVIGIGVFAFTLAAFLRCDARSFRQEFARPGRLALVLLWAGLGVPAMCLVAAWICGPLDDIGAGLLLAVLAPPGGSSAAMAMILGLNPVLALVGSMLPMLAAPVLLPWLAFAGTGAVLPIDPARMMMNLAAIIGGSVLAATLLRRVAPRFLQRHADGVTGVAVVGLLLAAIGSMAGVQAQLLANPWLAGEILGAACGIFVAMLLLGTLLFLGFGQRVAFTAGLLTSNRGVTLVMAAAGGMLPPATNLALAMSLLPYLIAPAVLRPILWQQRLTVGLEPLR